MRLVIPFGTSPLQKLYGILFGKPQLWPFLSLQLQETPGRIAMWMTEAHTCYFRPPTLGLLAAAERSLQMLTIVISRSTPGTTSIGLEQSTLGTTAELQEVVSADFSRNQNGKDRRKLDRFDCGLRDEASRTSQATPAHTVATQSDSLTNGLSQVARARPLLSMRHFSPGSTPC